MAQMVEVIISAKNQASGPIKEVSGDLRGLEGAGSKMGSVLSSVATVAMVGLGAAAASLGVGTVKSVSNATDFQKVISEVGAVSNATGPQLQGLSDLALKMGADTQFSASQAAEAMAELAKGGIAVADMAKVLPGVLDLAAAGGLTLAESATIATDTMSIFSKQGVNMEQVANAFAGAANISSISVQDMAESMKYVGPISSSMGLSLEDTAAAIALLGANGLKGSQAGTGLRTMMTSLASPSKEAAAVIKDLGLQFFDSQGKIKDFAGISDQLKGALKGMTDQQRLATLETLFGKEGMSAAIAMMGEGENSIQSYTQKLRTAASAHATGVAMMANFAGSMEALKGSVESASITLGLMLLPYLRDLVDWGTKAVNASVPFIKAWGPQLIAGIESGVGQAIAVVRDFGTAIAATVRAIGSGDFNSAFGPILKAIDTAFGGGATAKVTLFVSHLLTAMQMARDAVLTAKQAFAGDWIASDTIATPVRIVGQAFTLIGDAVREAQKLVAQLPAPVLAAAAAFVALGPAVRVVAFALPLLVGAFTGLGPIISVLTSTLPLLGSVIAAIGWPITAVVVAVGLLAAAWTTNFLGIRDTTMPILQQIGSFITGTFLPAVGQLGTYLMTNVVPLFVQGWAMIQQGVATALAAVTPYVTQFIGFLTGQLLPGIQGIVAVAVPAFQSMSAAIMGAFQAAAPGIQAFIGGVMALGATVLPIIGSVAGMIMGSLGPAVMAIVDWAQVVIPQFAAAFVAVAGVVGPIVGNIASVVGAALTAIAGFISEHSGTIVSVLQGAWDFISGLIGANVAIITGVISAGLQLISGDWTGAWETIKSTAQTVWDGIQTVISGAWTAITGILTIALDGAKTLLSGAWDSIKGTASTGWEAVKAVVSTAIDGMTTAVTSGIADVVSLMEGLPGKAAGAVGDLGSLLFGKGADLVQGLINGINSKIDEAIGLAADLAGKVAGAITGLWKEHSPSRLAMEIGQHFVDGLIIGMDNRGDDAVFAASTIARDLAATVASYTGVMQSAGAQLFGTLPVSARIEGSTLATEVNAQLAKVKGTVDAFASRLYGSGAGLVMNLANGWQEAAPGVLALANGLGADALAQFRKYDDRAKDAGKQLFGNVGAGFQEVAPGITTMVSTLAADIAATTRQIDADLATMTAQFGKGGDQAAATKQKAADITVTLGDGLSVFDKLIPLKDKPTVALTAVGQAMDDALGVAGGLVNQAKLVREDALDFLRIATEAEQAFDKGLQILGSIGKSGAQAGPLFIDQAPGVSGGTYTVPGRATGGPVAANQLYMVGENGPEYFLPRQSGTIVPNGASFGGGGGGGNMYISINVAGSVISEGQLVDKVRAGLLQKGRTVPTLGFN